MAPLGALIVYLTYFLATVGAVAFGAGLWRGWRPTSPGRVLLVIIYLPILALAIFIKREERRGIEWRDEGNFMRTTQDALREYYSLHPERFQRTGEDEAAEIIGLAAWLQDYLKARKSNWPEVTRQFHFKNDRLLDRAGYPIDFAVDFNRDQWISAFGQRIQVGDTSRPPSDRYVTTIALRLPPKNQIVHTTVVK